MQAKTIEEIIEYLESLGISTEYNDREDGRFNRMIKFTVNDVDYWIEWWINQCYLNFGKTRDSAFIPFKYINVNKYSPTTKFKLQLVFYNGKMEPTRWHDEFLFGVLKIPFNKTEL